MLEGADDDLGYNFDDDVNGESTGTNNQEAILLCGLLDCFFSEYDKNVEKLKELINIEMRELGRQTV